MNPDAAKGDADAAARAALKNRELTEPIVRRLSDKIESMLPPSMRPQWRAQLTQLLPVLERLEERVLFPQWAQILSKRSNMSAPTIAVAVAVVGAFIARALFRAAASLVANCIGFAFPAYQSLKALETRDTADDRQWLTYWTVFGSFSVIEYFSSFLLKWLPFYYAAKIAVLVYCFHPATRGAEVLHSRLLRPLFLKYSGPFEERLRAAGLITAPSGKRDSE